MFIMHNVTKQTIIYYFVQFHTSLKHLYIVFNVNFNDKKPLPYEIFLISDDCR